MVIGLIAEASPCCFSPVVGQFLIVAYVVGGALVYVWLLSMLFRWPWRRAGRRPSPTFRGRWGGPARRAREGPGARST